MTELIEHGYPVFLTGDFNEPSSLDYTKETVGSREGIPEPVPWPVSEELFEIGFRDTLSREHPDPLKEPGITHRPGERIDYVYAGGPSTTLASEIVGEKGGQDVASRSIAVDLGPPCGALHFRGQAGGDADDGLGRRSPANRR